MSKRSRLQRQPGRCAGGRSRGCGWAQQAWGLNLGTAKVLGGTVWVGTAKVAAAEVVGGTARVVVGHSCGYFVQLGWAQRGEQKPGRGTSSAGCAGLPCSILAAATFTMAPMRRMHGMCCGAKGRHAHSVGKYSWLTTAHLQVSSQIGTAVSSTTNVRKCCHVFWLGAT